ncbi:MAG: hypothetical protein WC545_00815 [Patescibacteria group bacterium]
MKKILLILLLSVVAFGLTAVSPKKAKKVKLQDCFEPILRWPIEIPANFSLEKFYKDTGDVFLYFNRDILKGAFDPSAPLYTGREHAFIYRLKCDLRSEQCLEFISKQKGSMPNAHRLFIIWAQLEGNVEPEDESFIFGLDYEKNLWLSNYGCRQVVFVSKNMYGKWVSNIACFEDGVPKGSYIVFTRKK